MKRQRFFIYPFPCLVFITVIMAFMGCTKDLTQKNILYTNDFNNGVAKGLAAYNAAGLVANTFEDFNGTGVFGRFFNNYLFIQFDNLPRHFAVTVEFDLYIHDKWEGDSARLAPLKKPDLWVMSVDDNPILVTTFSNTAEGQSYPLFYLPGNKTTPQTNALRTDLPGACSLKDTRGGTSLYRIVRTVAHTGVSFKVAMNDNLNATGNAATQLCTKSWSIDNLKISTIR
ncbi:MAG: hypothetical protein JWQ78_1224 [Sediminibacterium sp.]|nr:hypothetical protein [Sediminibacterium sp.]